MRGGGPRARRSRRRLGPIRLAVHDLALEAAAGDRDAPTRVGLRQARPPREVLDRGRSARGEVSPGQLEQRLVASQWCGGRYALLEQRVGALFATPRPAAHEAVELGAHQQLAQAL